ncbi:helix-turn-helix transcriptional regulator [Streptomyces sp. RFCAC02]|uniref:helix-turn-helix domain-containing protein n=1 Tax=Streptomyces sp. RFCAC02 TaxID=2499143 RepID=UPI00101F4AEE|nr:helix-turn-helix transcriptional regulator [Streptomyces sp. RFCAC02]
MANRKDLKPGDSPAAFCGAYMRDHRERAGLTLEALAVRVFSGAGYLAQIERAERRLQPELGILLDREFDTGKFFEDLATALCKTAGHAEHFVRAAEFEKSAEAIHEYVPGVVPGMLQIEPYAREIIEAADPYRSADKINALLAARLERSESLLLAGKVKYWAVLPEAVISARIGGPQTMRLQLEHIANLVREKRAVIQILPADATAAPAATLMMELMTFAEGQPLVFFETDHAGQLIDDPALVQAHIRSYDWLRAGALPPEASLKLIRDKIEELGE